MKNSDSTYDAIAYVEQGRYGNAIQEIERLTRSGNHERALAAAKSLCGRRGNATDYGVLIKACRRSSHEMRSQVYPSVVASVEKWMRGGSYEYRAQTLASLLTLLRLVDDRSRFWQIYDHDIHETDKRGNEFILAEYAQMLRQDNKTRYVDEWIPVYEKLPPHLQANDLLRKLYAQALLDRGTTPLEEVRAILEECRDEQFKDELLRRINTLSELRGTQPIPGAIDGKARSSPDTSRPKVFISYSRLDSQLADELAALLNEIGIPYFFDIKHIDWGHAVTTKIQEGISDCHAVVVIISPASLKSQWVHYEIGRATGAAKQILPFLTHPALDLPGYMRDLNYKTSLEEVRAYFEKVAEAFGPKS